MNRRQRRTDEMQLPPGMERKLVLDGMQPLPAYEQMELYMIAQCEACECGRPECPKAMPDIPPWRQNEVRRMALQELARKGYIEKGIDNCWRRKGLAA
jgi:hypothetical protein